ncbi:MAG: outer membrane receptor protein involved in Fe transport [Alcanivorax sp.]|jgi:outer membrane receptor protein involved in Fe transport
MTALNCVNSSLFVAATQWHLSGELVVSIISRRPCFEFNRIARACSVATAVGMTASVQAQDSALEEVIIVGQGSTYGNSVVTETMRRQQSNITSINALIDNLPGVTVNEGDTYGFDDWSTAITIRGFTTNLEEQQVGTTIDGLPNGGSNYGGGSKSNRFIDPANLGGIEVTQGTADISSRSHEALGGTINYMTDLPAQDQSFQAEVSIGEFDGRRYSVRYDTGEFAGNTKAWISYSYQEATDWITETAENERDHFAAKLVSDLDAAYITAYVSYDDTHEDNYQRIYSAAQFDADSEDDGLTARWTGVPNVDQNFRQAWSTLRENTFAYVKADFELSKDFALNSAVYYHHNEGRGDWVPPYLVDVSANFSEVTGGTTINGAGEITGTSGTFTYVDASGAPLTSTVPGCAAFDRNVNCFGTDAIAVQSYRHSHYEKDRTGLTLDFTWNTEIAGFSNELRGGLWYEDSTRDERRDWHRITDASVGPAFDSRPYYIQYSYSFPQETTKWYLQDSLTVNDFTLSLGVKQFLVDLERGDRFGDTTTIKANSDSDVLLSGGLVWETSIEGLEAFVGYSENFKAISDVLLEDSEIDLSTIEPETSTNMEIGLRYTAGKIVASATYFESDFENRLILVSVSSPAGIDYLGTGTGFYENSGGIDSSGLELALDYALTDQFSLYTAYTYNDSTYLGTGNTALDDLAGITPGLEVLGIPENQLVVSIDWAGASLFTGISAKYTDDRFANTTNTWKVDSYTVVDAYVGKTFYGVADGITLNLVANNLFDEDYLGSIVNNGAWLGAPRTVSLTATIDF